MVKEYLEKLRDELTEERLQLLNEETSLQNHYKENLKMIQLLEETNDPNYASFTPREIHPYNRVKIEELTLDQKKTTDLLEKNKIAISEKNYKIGEINSVIKVAKEEESFSSTSASNRFSILKTQEKERQRIARDLHDSTVQNLTSLVHKSELCIKLIDTDPIRCKLELSSLSKILRDIIEDTRNMIYDLRPMSFDDIGFDITVERYLDKIKSTTSTNFHYKVNGDPYPLDSVISLTLLRVIQEACSNAVKYADAQHVNVSLTYYSDSLILDIVDDGKGFDLSSMPQSSRDDNSGFGLSMMKERVFLLDGTIDIQSEVGKGFHIIVKIPIKQEGNKDGN